MTPSRVRALLLCTALCLVAPADAADPPPILYLGMHTGKARLRVDNRIRVLKIGDETRSGVKLVSVSREAAVVRYRGVHYIYTRGSNEGEVLTAAVSIQKDPNGMFLTRGAINGTPVEFLVDTGASHVVISAVRARQLRLRYRRDRPIRVQTASRVETAYQVTFDSVRVGGIFKDRVPGVVTRSKHPQVALLGMSFLGDLRISQEDDRLVIRQ